MIKLQEPARQTPDNWQGAGCKNYDDARDICLDKEETNLSEQSRKCPRCKGRKWARAPEDTARIKCPDCLGTGKVHWTLKKKTKKEDTSGADNMGTYRSVAVDDPFAARIQLANYLRKFADEVESVKDTASQFDPKKDTYDSESIQGFIDAIGATHDLVRKAAEEWKSRMARIEQDMEKQLESITIPVDKGDTILGGRFKNKKIKVKSIGKDEHDMPTINGRKVVTFRMGKKDETVESLVRNLVEIELSNKLKRYAGRYGGEPDKLVPSPGNLNVKNPVTATHTKGGKK